jgi:two-component system, NtrC family, sensor histidine kinase KinB
MDPGDRVAAALVATGLAYLPWEILSGHSVAHARLCDLAFLAAGFLASSLVLGASRSPNLDAATAQALHRIGWGYVAYWLGDVTWSASQALLGAAPPFALHRVFYLAYYGLLLWGAFSFPRADGRLRDRLFWLDAGAALVGAAMVVWYVALERATRTAVDDTGAAWLFVAFAIGDLFLLLAFALMILRGAHPERRQALLLLAFGVLLAMLGHGLYSVILFSGYRGMEATPDSVVMLSWVCAGLGGQLYRKLGTAHQPALAPQPPGLSVIPLGAIGLGYGVLLLASLQRTASVGLVVGAATLVAIALVRQVVAGRDTARLLAEQASLAQRARFEALVESSADVTVLIGPDGAFRYVSRSIERVLGRGPADLIGSDAFALMHPDDVEECRRVFAFCLASVGVPCHAEFRFRHADGSWRWVDADGISRVGDPEIDAVVASFRDVTERRVQDEGLRKTERELRAQKELLANLLAVARATAEQPTLDTTLKNTIEVMLRVTGSSGGSMFLLEESGRIRSSVHADAQGKVVHEWCEADTVMRGGLAGWVARHREPSVVPDVTRDERWLDIGSEGIGSALCVPIQSGGTLLGLLTLVHPRTGYFAPHHQTLASAAGDQIALALRNAQVFDALGAMARRLRLLNDIVHDAGLRLDPDALLRSAVETIAQRTSWMNVVLSVPDDERRYWRIRASAEDLSRVGSQRVDEGVVGRAFVSGRTQLVPDVRQDPDYIAGSPLVKSELCVPLRRGERVLGVLNLESDRLDGFGAEDVRLAEALAETLSLSLDDARLYRKLAEESERLDAVIRSSRDGILLASASGRVLIMNDPAARFFGITGAASRWLDRPLVELSGAVPAPVLAALRGGVDSAGELEVPPRVVEWRVTPVSAGASEGRLLVVRDVTEARRLEAMREELTDTLVHDLRSPLNAITGFLQTLEDTPLPASQSELLAIAGRAAHRLLSLVNTILDVSRLEKGAMPVDRREIDVDHVVSSVLDMQLPVARLRGVRLSSEGGAGCGAWSADPELLNRILENLVSNALRHTPRGGEVKVRLSQDAELLRVAVSDDGPGIPEADAERVFEKFVTGGRGSRNSGLGLAFCKLAVEAHGGHIRVERPPGGGAVFAFTIPAG